MIENEMTVSVPLEVVKASEIEPKEVKWLWYPYIPFGKVTLLQGDPGDGKSKLMLSVAALLSKGEPLPFTETEENEPVTIIYQTTEDDADDTVVPRFNSAGGNGENLIFIREDEKSLSFGDNRIREAIEMYHAKLLILDPMSSYIGEICSMNNANETRAEFNHFYSLLQPEDVEDLLALWLYDTKGYVCIPSTNKIATPKYECVLVDPNDLNRKHIYIQVKKGDVDLNTDDYSSLNGEVYLLTTDGNVQNAQKYSNVKVADPTVIYEFAINPDKSHIIPENVLYWVKFLTEIENNRLKFSACKGIMFDTNISYSDTDESEMILGNKIAAYGDAKRYIDSFRKDDYALFYSKGRGIIAVGQIVTDTPTEVGNEKYHSVRMIVPENFNGDVKALPALSPNEIKTILKRNFYWASTIKTPFLTGVQVEMLIRELKKKHISAFGKYKIEY